MTGADLSVVLILGLYHFRMENANEERDRALNCLSIDGGGSGRPALEILREILSRIQYDLRSDDEILLRQYFDVIGGTRTGGLIVLLLGRLGLSPSQAIEAYTKLLPALSVKPAENRSKLEENTQIFETAFENVLTDAGLTRDAPMLNEEGPKIIVYGLRPTNSSDLQPIRSYRSNEYTPPYTILQAACACIASPNKFLPVTIEDRGEIHDLIDASITYPNVSSDILQEANRILGEDTEVATILSIGSDSPFDRTLSIRRPLFSFPHIVPVIFAPIILAIYDSFSPKSMVTILLSIVGALSWCTAVLQGSQNQQERSRDLVVRAMDGEREHNNLYTRLHKTNIYFRLKGIREQDFRKPEINVMLDEVVKSIQLQIRIDRVKLANINPVLGTKYQPKPRPSLVPHFTGRDDILSKMRDTHFNQCSPYLRPVTVLFGLGGSGKTQTALKFALEFEENYPDVPVYFVDASSETGLQADYRNIIRSHDVSYHAKSYQDAIHWLSTSSRDWLLILDDVDNLQSPLDSLLPHGTHGDLIITTRNATFTHDGSHHLEGLSTSESTALLLKLAKYPESEENIYLAQAIADELGHLPHALAISASYIYTLQSLSKYLEIFRKKSKDLMALCVSGSLNRYNLSIAANIQVSIDRLSERAKDMLKLFSHLHALSIARDIIEKAAKRQFRSVACISEFPLNKQTIEHANALLRVFCPNGEWSDFEFNELVRECLTYSWLQVKTQEGLTIYSMHALVQAHLKNDSDPVQKTEPAKLIPRLLGSSIILDEEHECFDFCRLLAPHLKLIHPENVIEAGDHFAFGDALRKADDYSCSLVHWERCLKLWEAEIWKREMHIEHPDGLAIYLNLTDSYIAVERYGEALEYKEKVLDIQRALFGREDVRTLSTMSELAELYSKRDSHESALELKREVLDEQKKHRGPEHPQTLIAMASLAATQTMLDNNQADP